MCNSSFFSCCQSLRSVFSRIVLTLFLMGFFNSAAEAKGVRELWLAMPDSIVPYLNNSMRTQCVDLYDMKSDAMTDNLLKGKSRIDTLTANFLKATLNSSCEMQMKILPGSGTDSLLCVLRSIGGAGGESEVAFFTLDWKPVGRPLSFNIDEFVTHSDSLSASRREYLVSCLDPLVFKATLSASDNSLVVSVTNNALNPEDKKALDLLLLQRKLNWDGNEFK